jgi:limonene-1,2-epoxide hydrolase
MQNRKSERILQEFLRMKEENIKVVKSYLNALRKKDLTLAPLGDSLQFENPIAGKNTGAENFKAFLAGFLLAINDLRVIQHVCEGEYIVTLWEADTVFGTISVLEKFRVQDKKITESLSFFDPRPILGS